MCRLSHLHCCSCLLSIIPILSSLFVCSSSLSSHLFLPTLPTVSPSLSLCGSVILPRLFYLSPSFFLPICFFFSAVSNTALLCFSSSDPTLEHLREIRRKLASEKPAVKGFGTVFALQISVQHCETLSNPVLLCLRNNLLVVLHVSFCSLMH